MPPSARKGKTRARRAPAAEAQEASDIETPEAITTPTRSSRKRARAAEPVAPASRSTRRKTKDTRAADREDTEGTEAQDNTDDDTEPAAPTEAEIIAHLKVAERHVNATEDFANDLLEGQENVPGYGKIAGRDWAFIIRKVEVNIGRPEATEKLTVEDGAQTNGTSGPSARTVVDIDLGPDRQVSRSHAIISYDPDSMQWFIIVNGRNGLRVDTTLLKRGMKTYLRNGSVIEIANTQMAFITTAADNEDGPLWDGAIIRQAQKSSEEDEDGDDDTRANNHRRPAYPPARNNLQDSSIYGQDISGQQRRTHPHSQTAALQAAPGTPMRSQQLFPKSSPAANYARGVMMESTETIDYSADNAKDLKPPHSYAQLIGMAILSTHEQQMTLNNIYKWIMSNYAFYRFNTGGWQNSIRHNLSLNKAFTKIARRTDEPGKGMKWMIEPTEFDTFVQQGMKGCRRPNPLPGTQSTFGSPSSPMHILKSGGGNGPKRNGEVTPPINAYRSFPAANEAYTPERGPKRQIDTNVGLGLNEDGPEYDFLSRSTPRNGLTAIANAAGSPPALFVNDEARVGALDTPFPLRPAARFAPPSTLRRPSDFIQFSSPAPFWKMEGLTGSTPFKPYDLSPLKTPFANFKKEADEGADDGGIEADGNGNEQNENVADDAAGSEVRNGEAAGRESPVIESSSPPRSHSEVNDLEQSPTKSTRSTTISRPASAVAKTLSQISSAPAEAGEGAGVQAASTKVEAVTSASVGFGSSQPPAAVQVDAPPAPTSSDTYESMRPATNGYAQPPQNHVANPTAYAYNGPPPLANGYAQPPQNHVANPTAYAYNGPPPLANGYIDDGEDEGIDLAKGFQPIGAFHQRNHLAMSMGMQPATTSSFGR